jgi:hypothetical protein
MLVVIKVEPTHLGGDRLSCDLCGGDSELRLLALGDLESDLLMCLPHDFRVLDVALYA